MAFCSNCGNQLTGNEKFCAQCGSDISTKRAGTPSPAASTPIATPPAAPPPVQPMGGTAYPAGVPVPVAVPVPPSVQPAAQKKGVMGTVVVLAIIAALAYYYYNKAHSNPTPSASNPPASQPGSPSNPPTNPPGGGSGGGNAALVNQQSFTAQWANHSGMLVLTSAKWSNNSTANLASAVVQCEQNDNNGTDLSQYRVTLNGPTPPNTWSSYSNIQIGAVANNMTKVNCTIVHVKTSN